MSKYTHNKPRVNKLYSLYVWHRYLGLTAAILVLVLAITGLMLNHTERFELDESYIKSNALLDWYNVKLPNKLKSYQTEKERITQLDSSLYFNQHPLHGEFTELHGALVVNEMIVVAVDESILLFLPSGELIEKLNHLHGVPSNLSAIGLTEELQVVVRAHGELYVADEDLFSWAEIKNNRRPIDWAQISVLPSDLKKTFSLNFRQHILPLEKVVLDLHSGRIFGSYGIYVMDAAAIILCILAISGSTIWIIQTRKRRQRVRLAKSKITVDALKSK